MDHVRVIHDLTDPDDPQERTYKEVNAEKTHAIPVGALVEVDEVGTRLFVVYHGRDCDMTPLYWLGPEKDDTVQRHLSFANPKWIGGYPESGLTVIRPPAPSA